MWFCSQTTMIAWTWEVFCVSSDDPGKMMVVLQVGRFYYCISILLHYICYNSFWICLQSFVLFVLAVLAGGSDIVCRFLLLQPSRNRKQKLPLLARETRQDSVADESKMANTIKIIMGSYHWLINVKRLAHHLITDVASRCRVATKRHRTLSRSEEGPLVACEALMEKSSLCLGTAWEQ